MKEIWKDFVFGGIEYRVSNKGRLIGMRSGKILKTRLNKDGYVCVTLGSNTKRLVRRVHRLVAENFIPNPNNYPEVNHIDFDRANNNITNLEWITHEQNVQYTVDANRHVGVVHDYSGKNNPNYGNHILKYKYAENPELAKELLARPAEQNGRAKTVYLYDKDKKFIKEFKYIGACAEYLKELGLTKATINSIRMNLSKSIKENKMYLKHYFSFERK